MKNFQSNSSRNYQKNEEIVERTPDVILGRLTRGTLESISGRSFQKIPAGIPGEFSKRS